MHNITCRFLFPPKNTSQNVPLVKAPLLTTSFFFAVERVSPAELLLSLDGEGETSAGPPPAAVDALDEVPEDPLFPRFTLDAMRVGVAN